MKKRGLGRGLDALLQGHTSVDNSDENGTFRSIAVSQLIPGPYQPRTGMREESLKELAESIKAQGLVQPIVVRQKKGDAKTFEIIAGERRWRASQIAGLKKVPVLVRDIPDQSAMSVALIENIQREALNPLEEAQAIFKLIETFKMTHAALAESIGRSRSSVSNLLRLLELNEKTKYHLEHGKIEMGHARALLTLSQEEQDRVVTYIVEKDLSVRETERFVRNLRQLPSRQKKQKTSNSDVHLKKLQEELSDKLGTPVHISHKTGGSGVLSIRYHSLEVLDGILEHIK